jgi:hypothetical protein
MSFFKDFGLEPDPNRFDSLLKQRAGANSANDSKPTSEAPTLSNIQVVATSQAKSDNVCKIPAKHQMTEGECDTKTGVSGSAGHKAITKDKLKQSNTQKKKNVKAIADAEGISVTGLKKKLKAERAAKTLAEQKDKERQDRKLKNKQERKYNLRDAAET